MSAHLREAWRRLSIGDYMTGHQPGDEAPSLDDLTDPTFDMYPVDVYDHPERYAFNYPGAAECVQVVLSVRGKPNAPVDIYRSLPPEVPEVIETGNWVTLSVDYARHHGISNKPQDDEPWDVVKATVPTKTVRNGGNDIVEWGYWGPPVGGIRV